MTSIFRVVEPAMVTVSHADGSVGLLARCENPTPDADGLVKADLITIDGQVVESDATFDLRSDLADLAPDQPAVFLKAKHLSPGERLIAFLRAGDGQQNFIGEDLLEDTSRYTCSVWMERGFGQLSLTDSLTNKEVFCLVDDAIGDAIESGYLSAPRRPRASESDWLPQLIDYARESGMLDALDLVGQHTPRAKASAQRAVTPA